MAASVFPIHFIGRLRHDESSTDQSLTGEHREDQPGLRNFEIWQLGMLFVVLQDMEDELIRIGSGRSRGLGKIKAEISEQGSNGRPGGFVVSIPRGNVEPSNELWGLGRWLNDESYGTRKDDSVILPQPVARSQRAFSGSDLDAWREAAIAQFIERIQHWPDPPGISGALATSR